MATKQLASAVARLNRRRHATAKDIELWANANLHVRVSNESCRKALAGQIDPTQCAVELLMAITGFYGVSPADLGHHAEARLAPLLTFASAITPGPDGPGGQVIDASGWFVGSRLAMAS